ncbi:MAG: hypothetical protein ACKV2T_14220 [Kofleriaceae bacterium]
MNHAARLAFVLIACSSMPAFAQYATPPEAGPGTVQPVSQPVVVVQPIAQPAGVPLAVAPQNEDWNNVNHINGVPVKVGERGDYLHRFRKTNISSNPIGWMFGVYGLSVSHAIHNNVVVRLDGNIFSGFIDEMSGYEVGASLPIYFKRAYSGPFIEPGLISRGVKYDRNYYYDSYDTMESTMETSFGPQMLFGWHWTFDSGLNVAAAAGAMRNLNVAPADEYGYQEDSMEFVGYFRVGYAF